MITRYGSQWLEIALEVIEAAQRNEKLSQFEEFQRLAPSEPGKGLQDRIRVLAFLRDSGSVQITDDKLHLNSSGIPEWLAPNLVSGDEDGWKIVDAIDPTGEIARKFDSTRQAEIGLNGEKFIVDCLVQLVPLDFQKYIMHVSLKDDTKGFDVVSPTIDGTGSVLLEVKTSTRQKRDVFSFYLSRHEAEVGLKNPNWFLVAVEIKNGDPSVVGFTGAKELEMYLPQDMNRSSKWQSVYVAFPTQLLSPGLPIRPQALA